MDTDDLEPRQIRTAGWVVGCDLSLLGVRELKEYLAELDAEIVRVRGEIGKKDDVRSQAEAFFKTR